MSVTFVIGRYGPSDWRLVRWNGSTKTEIGPDGGTNPLTGWGHEPDLREVGEALMDYHGTGDQPFASRAGALDSMEIGQQWPLPIHDLKAGHEFPWNR